MPDCYIFDFDYTLADSSIGALKCIRYALGQMGYDSPDEERLKNTIGFSLADTFGKLTGNDDDIDAMEFSRLFIEEADKVMCDFTSIFRNVPQSIIQLHGRGKKLGIVSTKFRYRIESILQREKLDSYIDVIIGGEDVKCLKPDSEPLLKAIDILNVEKENVLYVGDSIVDAKTAENAGVRFIASLTGTTTREAFNKFRVHRYINDISELS